MLLSSALLAILASFGSTPESAVPVQKEPMHRPVYEGQGVRVLDVVIPPHATTLYHTHSNDIAGVTITPGPGRSEEAGSPAVDEPPDKPGAVWFEPHPTPYTHRGTNLGDQPIHIVGIELLGHKAQTRRHASNELSGGIVDLDNARISVIRFALAPSESLPQHTHQGAYVLVVLESGRLADACGRVGSQTISEAGFVCAGNRAHGTISNVGDSPVTVLEFNVAQ